MPYPPVKSYMAKGLMFCFLVWLQFIFFNLIPSTSDRTTGSPQPSYSVYSCRCR